MSTASHKAIVRRYLEAVDQRNVAMLDDIVATDCLIHRPEQPEPLRGLAAFKQFFASIPQVYSELTTTIDDLFAEEDRVACRVSHRAVYRGEWISRLGRHAVGGKTVRWSVIAIFRLREGKIGWCPSIACTKYAQRVCLLYPPEARDTIHLRSVLWSAPSAPGVMGWRPAGHGSKRRNSLTRCAPWPKVIRFREPHPREELDRPTMPAGVMDEAWTMEALLSYHVARDFHAQLDS